MASIGETRHEIEEANDFDEDAAQRNPRKLELAKLASQTGAVTDEAVKLMADLSSFKKVSV